MAKWPPKRRFSIKPKEIIKFTEETRHEWIRAYLEKRLSEMWTWYPPRTEVKREAQVTLSGGIKLKDWMYCAICGGATHESEIEVDHIQPKVPLTGATDIGTWIDRWLCPKSNLRALCKWCHKGKSKLEAGERAKLRRKCK